MSGIRMYWKIGSIVNAEYCTLCLQANQEKLARMLGSINAMFLMCFRLSKLHEAGKMSHADASMVKAWTTLRGDSPFCDNHAHCIKSVQPIAVLLVDLCDVLGWDVCDVM